MTKTEPTMIYTYPHRDWPKLAPWQQSHLAEVFEPVVEHFRDISRKRGPVAADEYLATVAARISSGSSKAERKRSNSGSVNSAAESVGLDSNLLNLNDAV